MPAKSLWKSASNPQSYGHHLCVTGATYRRRRLTLEITLIDKPVNREQVKLAAWPFYEEVVKAVVDVERRTMAIGGEMQADEEQFLLRAGSRQEDLWGINIFTELAGSDMIEFDSLINIRPTAGNRSRGVEDPAIRQRIIEMVGSLVKSS